MGIDRSNVYTLLYTAIQTLAVVVITQSFLRFDRRFSWLGGLTVFVWLAEQVLVRKSVWSLLRPCSSCCA